MKMLGPKKKERKKEKRGGKINSKKERTDV
jgi:hypothetical protein